MSSTVPRRQHAVKAPSPPEPRTPAGDAFTALVLQVIRLNGRFTVAGEALPAAGGGLTGEPLDHHEVLAAGQAAAERMGTLLRNLVAST